MESTKTAKTAIPHGGYECPHCGAQVLTEKGFVLIPGVGSCPVCKNPVEINDRVASSANEARKLMILTNAFLGIGVN
jgi:hypothetical protein